MINAILTPATSPLTVGQSLADTAGWSSFLAAANYVGAAPIASVTVNYVGSAFDATTALADGDVNQFRITVADTGGGTRTFSTVPRLVIHPTAINTTRPVVSGNTGLGDILTTTDGIWAAASGGVFSYQWLRGATAISGATAPAYTIAPEDDQADLRCIVTYTNSGGAVSAGSVTITVDDLTAPSITGVPSISGVERVGQLLTAVPASVTNGGTRTWQWFANDTVIGEATSSTYQLTASQDGVTITVRQTQINSSGLDSATSAATGTVTYAAPSAFGALSDQSFTKDTGVQTYDVSADFTGSDLTFSVNSLVGVSIDSATGVVSFDTDVLTLQASTSIVVTASNSGGNIQSGLGVSITEIAFSVTDNADGTIELTTEGILPSPMLTDNGDGTATTDEAGAYIYKLSANAEDDFTGAVGSDALTTATGAGTFKVYKRVQSNVAVTSAPVVSLPTELAAIGARLWGWYDLTDTTKMFQNVNYTTAASADNDPIRAVADSGGNGTGNQRGLQIASGAVYRTAGFASVNSIITIDTPPVLSDGMEIYIGFKSTDTLGMLINFGGGSDPAGYAGVVQSGNGASALSVNAGTVAFVKGSPPVDQNIPHRNELYRNFCNGLAQVVGMQGLDLATGTASGTDTVSVLSDQAGTLQVAADISEIIITETLTPTERTDIAAYMNGRLP